jgi:hypothetical protein
MKNSNPRLTTKAASAVLASALTMAFIAALPQPGYAQDKFVQRVPDNIKVTGPDRVFEATHSTGTQNYVCLPSGAGFAWTLFTPQATLFRDNDRQVITHFFSPNPEESRTIRAAWQDSNDSSTVWAKLHDLSTDSRFVAAGAIPWLLLDEAGVQEGPTGGHALTETTFIQRINTAGGVAPSTGCSAAADVGKTAFVPYSADYIFFKKH